MKNMRDSNFILKAIAAKKEEASTHCSHGHKKDDKDHDKVHLVHNLKHAFLNELDYKKTII